MKEFKMKKRFLQIIMLICAVVLLCMESAVFSFAEDGEAMLNAPENISFENTESGIKISWAGVENSTGYKIYRWEDESEPVILEYVSGEDTLSFTDETAKSGVLYNYCIKAYNSFADGELSESFVYKHLSVPTLSKASNGYGGIELNWLKTPGAEGYTVYKKTGNKTTKVVTLKGENKCTYLDKNVAQGERYRYYVIANCGEYLSAYKYKVSSVYVVAPTVKEAVNRNGYIKVSWNKTKNADSYKIYRKAGSDAWKGLKTVKNDVTSFNDKSVKNGVTYSYRVLALKGNDKSGYIKDGTTSIYIQPPQNITVSNTSFDGCYVKWSKVGGAGNYRVYRKDSKNKSWKLLKTVTGNSYNDTTAKNGTEYTYTVRANGKTGGRSYYLSGTKAPCIHMPDSVKLASTTTGVKIAWSKVSYGDGYRVYRKNEGAKDYKLIKKITSNSTTSYTDTTAVNGKSYVYTVRAVKGKVNGSYSKNGYSVKYITAPNLYVSHSPKGVVLSWSKSPVGTGYEIQRMLQGEKKYTTYALINDRNVTSVIDSAPAYGKYNYYRIKVIYNKSLISNSQKIFGIDPNKKMVALTYDDGPNTDVTNSILDTLKKNNSRATFFVVGSRVNTYKDCIIKANNQGCEIGNHSYNHTILTSVNSQKINSEINSTNTAVKNLIGKSPSLVRTPGGATNSTVRSTVKYPIIQWNVDTLDWKYRNAATVVSNVKSNVRDGSIVLMHDLYSSTATATKEIVPWLIKNGYQIVTVSEMMAVKGIDMKAGTVYYSAN